MSATSRKLKNEELPMLYNAQINAARMCDEARWTQWMRSTYTYALAVRMAVEVGCKKPGHEFHDEMFRQGQILLQKEAA